MLPIRNISYLLPMCCSFREKCISSPKTDLRCSTPLNHILVFSLKWLQNKISSPAIGPNKCKKLTRPIATAHNVRNEVWIKNNLPGFTNNQLLICHFQTSEVSFDASKLNSIGLTFSGIFKSLSNFFFQKKAVPRNINLCRMCRPTRYLNGCAMGPLLVLVFTCFRETVVVTCKIGSFLCNLDNLLQKNVIVFFFENQISKWHSFKKRAIFGLLFTFFSYQGKVTKIKFSNAPSRDNWFTPWREMDYSSPGDVCLFCFFGQFLSQCVLPFIVCIVCFNQWNTMFYYRFRSATFRISSLIYWPLIEQDGFFILIPWKYLLDFWHLQSSFYKFIVYHLLHYYLHIIVRGNLWF